MNLTGYPWRFVVSATNDKLGRKWMTTWHDWGHNFPGGNRNNLGILERKLRASEMKMNIRKKERKISLYMIYSFSVEFQHFSTIFLFHVLPAHIPIPFLINHPLHRDKEIKIWEIPFLGANRHDDVIIMKMKWFISCSSPFQRCSSSHLISLRFIIIIFYAVWYARIAIIQL